MKFLTLGSANHFVNSKTQEKQSITGQQIKKPATKPSAIIHNDPIGGISIEMTLSGGKIDPKRKLATNVQNALNDRRSTTPKTMEINNDLHMS